MNYLGLTAKKLGFKAKMAQLPDGQRAIYFR